jgi:hypothetical protein
LFFFKNSNIIKTPQFLLNAEDQNNIEKDLTEKQKTDFRKNILFKKYNNNSFFTFTAKQNDSSFFAKTLFYNKLTSLKPIFNFFVYNVDKNIKKFSRGKSGNYIFV